DFSCVLMDGDAQIVAMSKGQDHPLHIVPIAWSMKAVREKVGDDIHPGDMFLHNDPYTGGTHLNDVALIYPLFADGRMFVFPGVRAHWGDVGGMSPGSLSGGATEIFQEGVRIPPIRIIDRGRPNEAALDLIFSNMRGPRERMGDFDAMIGTCKKAAERVEGLAAKYGTATVRAAVTELMDRAELRMRRAIGALRDGGSAVSSRASRPLTVITPRGTIVNANPPAPCGGMVEVKYCVETAVMGALAPALDGKIAGDLKGGGNHCYVGGPHPRTGET